VSAQVSANDLKPAPFAAMVAKAFRRSHVERARRSSLSQAQSATDKYELSALCGKQAAERFSKESIQATTLLGPTVTMDYENHYSLRLDRCFYLEITKEHRPDEGPPFRMMTLRDLNESRVIARYHKANRDRKAYCWLEEVIDNRRCESEEEFRALIKPLMED
jgi:hypothetical protein